MEKNQNNSWNDLSEPEKMSARKNQDKPLRDLNLTSRSLEKNQNKSQSGLSEPEKISAGKNQDKLLRDLN